jgi:hypothetical protein
MFARGGRTEVSVGAVTVRNGANALASSAGNCYFFAPPGLRVGESSNVAQVGKLVQWGGGFVTGYTVHTGSSKKFAAGWEQVFGARKKKAGASEARPAAQPKAAKRTTKAKKKK